MTIRRSASGLANLHLFLKVDIVVYCEGGQALSFHDAIASDGDQSTLDCAFWKRIASFLQSKRKYHFKSVGSKSTLLSIIDDVVARNLQTIIVCLDRDYDFHCNRERPEPFVAYTSGYSWENDVLSNEVLEKILFKFVAPDAENVKWRDVGFSEIEKFKKAIHPWCESEMALSLAGKDLIFDRNKPVQFLDRSKRLPKFSKSRAITALKTRGYNRRPRTTIKTPCSETFRNCWGKLISRYCYHLVLALIQRTNGSFRLHYDVFMSMAIAETVQSMSDGQLPSASAHYSALGSMFS